MLDEIITDIKKRLADQPDSRCASADEVRICWLISELEGIKKRHAELRKVYDDTQNYAVGLANGLHEFYKKESPEFEPFDRPDYVLTQIDNMISGILDRYAELVELVKEVRANDCGAWMKECGSVFKCSDGTVKRQELARLLDKLYKVSGV